MTEREMIIEQVKSLCNRYEAILELMRHCLDLSNPPAYFYTLIEDAAQYAEELMMEFCEVEDGLPKPSETITGNPSHYEWPDTASPPTDGNTTLEQMGDWK
jgi:hypothetical protein